MHAQHVVSSRAIHENHTQTQPCMRSLVHGRALVHNPFTQPEMAVMMGLHAGECDQRGQVRRGLGV